MSLIADIEQAILDRLRAAAETGGPWGYRVPVIESYGDELEGDPKTSLARGQAPAIWVVFGGEEGADRRALRRLRFSIVILTRNYRNERASRRGDGTSPGAYQLIEDVRGVLVGDHLGGLLATGLDHLRTRSLVSQKSSKVYAIDVEARADDAARYADIDPSALADFAHFHADWDVPPLGNVQPPLPAAQADATDDVHLPIQEDTP